MRLSRSLFHDVIRCRVDQRDGRRWYTITNTKNQRPNAYPPSSSSSSSTNSTKTRTRTRSPAVEIDAAFRPAPSLSNKVEPFNLPRVVIDLDAVDSPYVVAAKPRRPWIHSRGRRDMRKPTKPIPKQTPKLKFGATPPEILAFALLGDSSRSDTLQSKYMQTFLQSQRLHTTPTEQDYINKLALDLQLDPAERLRDERFVIEKRILDVSDIVELRRIVDLLSTTLEGCQILDHHLTAAIQRTLKTRQNAFHTGKKATNLDLLVLLNNTCINMISRGLTPHPRLVNAALYHASKCESLPAIRQYLSLSAGQGWEFCRAMRHLQLCLVRTKQSSPATSILPWMGKDVRKREFLKLLTGWQHGHKPTQGESRGLSFALLSPVFSQSHSIYIMGLGEAGLCETLDAEWKIAYQENVLSKFLLNSQLFAMAHLLANNNCTAASILAAVPGIMEKVNLTTAQYQDGAQLKYHASTRVLHCDIPETMKYLVFQHYNFHGVRASAALNGHCRRTIERVQHLVRFNPTQAFRELNSLLVVGFSARGSQSPFDITWDDIPASVKEGNEECGGSSSLQADPEDQTPLGVDIEETEKFLGDETIPGLSSGMCELLRIRRWSELGHRREQMAAEKFSVLRGLVVECPGNNSLVYAKPFVIDERE